MTTTDEAHHRAGDGDVKIIRDGLTDRIPAQALRIEKDAGIVLSMLQEKSTEEVREFAGSGWSDPSELADALEVLHGLAHHAGIDWETVETARIHKRRERGGFEDGLVYDRRLDPTIMQDEDGR